MYTVMYRGFLNPVHFSAYLLNDRSDVLSLIMKWTRREPDSCCSECFQWKYYDNVLCLCSAVEHCLYCPTEQVRAWKPAKIKAEGREH